jgi:hypothetical protein
MRFVTDRCIQCGTSVRPTNLTTNYQLIDKTGTHSGTDFWFCSEDHYQEALSKYIPKEFAIGRTTHDVPELKELFADLFAQFERRDLASFDECPDLQNIYMRGVKDWYEKQASYNSKAQGQLRDRLKSEANIQKNERDKKERTVREKEEAKEEQERLAEEAEREKLEPRDIPPHIRFEHTHILGPQGSGKTTLLQHIFLEDLKSKNPPAYVIIDPKGLLVERIAHLQVFHHNDGRLRDRFVFIDPLDSPALNMFRIPLDRFTKDQRSAILNQLIELFSYVFSSAQSRLTQRQSIPFGFVLRLVFSMGGDLNTLMDVLEDDHKTRRFAPQIERFAAEDSTGAVSRFFRNDFYSEGFKATREQIRTRLYEIIGRPELARMFLAPVNKLDLFDCIQKRKIILVNTGMSYLGSNGSQLLGRYIIAMTMNAVLSRYFIPQSQWNPVYLMIDEFQDFADEENTPKLLRLVREYKMGVVMAHQTMYCTELNQAIRTSISTSAIKYAASPEGDDLRYMAQDLRCDPDFLRAHQVRDGHVNFACYARGMHLDHPFSVRVPIGNIGREPQMQEHWYDSTRGWNTFRVCYEKAINEDWTDEDWAEYERMISGDPDWRRKTHEGCSVSAPEPSTVQTRSAAKADKPPVPPKNNSPKKWSPD